MSEKTYINHLLALKDKWPSTIVARTEIKAFSGGALNSGTLKNMDALRVGPKSFRLGRKICYPVDGLISWMIQRSTKE